MRLVNALPFGSRLNSSAIHAHLFIGVAEPFFLPIIPSLSLEPIRFDAYQRDRREP